MFSLFPGYITFKYNDQLPIGLPAQWVLLKPQLPLPRCVWNQLQNVYHERSILTIVRKNRGLWTVYRHTASCGSLSCSCYILASHAGVFRGAHFSSVRPCWEGWKTSSPKTPSWGAKSMLPPSFPYPSPPRTQGPVQSCQSWWRHV